MRQDRMDRFQKLYEESVRECEHFSNFYLYLGGEKLSKRSSYSFKARREEL